MLVKTIVSAAGADFTIEYGTEFEFDELKKLIGNGAENFCRPVDPDVEWPPATVVAESETETEVETAVVPAVETPEVVPVVETAVVTPPPERTTKARSK